MLHVCVGFGRVILACSSDRGCVIETVICSLLESVHFFQIREREREEGGEERYKNDDCEAFPNGDADV